jgi:hypothetical protein
MYLLNLIHNIIFIFRYFFKIYLFETDKNNKQGKYAMIMAMIQLLKFDVRLFQNDKKMYINKNLFTDIDLIIQNKKKFIYMEVKSIENNKNNDSHMYLSNQIQNQKLIIGVENMIYILYIYGEKLLDITENMIRQEHPDIYIYYNKIDKIPEQIYDKNIIMFTEGNLGFICSYYYSDYIFNKLMQKLNKYELCIYDKFFKSFDKRMDASNIDIERERWNKIKHKFNIIYDTDFTDKYCIIESFPEVAKKNINYLKYIFMNNFKCLTSHSQMGKYNNYMHDISIYSLPIYGARDDVQLKKRNWFVKNAIIMLHKIYMLYFIFCVKI